MTARFSIAVLGLSLALAGPLPASDVGYLYGRVETEGGDTYEGQIRWGKEEAFWDDIFNADRVENEHLTHLSRAELDRIRSRQWGGWFMEFYEPDLTHMCAVRFGDLKRLDVEDGEKLTAVFRNGREARLKGGSNDVGARITVLDAKQGRRELPWSRIRSIEFRETPAKLDKKLGEPIYGSVKSGRYEFVGRIQWDHDECLSGDELDGETRNGKTSIAFGDIAAIRKHRSGALVTTKSGAETYLSGSNDVNDGNRGVVVIVPRLGSVRIGWEDFDEVTFRDAPDSGPGYADFAKESELNGTVVTRNGREEGRIVFDLDESWDFELLHGRNHDTEYLIPFRDIARIRPAGLRRSIVELRMGLTVELEESQDVTRQNTGLLVFAGGKDPKYVDWREVTEITFR